MKVQRIEIDHFKTKLRKPYALSFGTLTHFDVVRAQLYLESGEKTEFEVVPLPGYNEETVDSIITFVNSLKPRLEGLELKHCRTIIKSNFDTDHFARSLLLNCIDLIDRPALASKLTSLVEFVSPIAVEEILDLSEVSQENSIKVKLSGDLEHDLGYVLDPKVGSLKLNSPIRLDVNQGYSVEEANKFISILSSSNNCKQFAYLEQPIDAKNWEGIAQLQSIRANLPLMLDEMIIDEEDLYRAHSLGIEFVKLKLYKQGGVTETEGLIKLAAQLGIKVVLGNGVSTLIGNNIENNLYLEYKDSIFGASEANGFLKLQSS